MSAASVERMRRHRIELEYALAHNLPLSVARARLIDERLHARKRAIAWVRAPQEISLPPAPAPQPRQPFWWEDRD